MTANISKYMSLSFLYLAGFIFAGVVAYQMIIGHSPDTLAVGIVNIIIGYVINSVGVQHGVSVTNDTVQKVATAQLPIIEASKKAASDSNESEAASLVQSVHSGH